MSGWIRSYALFGLTFSLRITYFKGQQDVIGVCGEPASSYCLILNTSAKASNHK